MSNQYLRQAKLIVGNNDGSGLDLSEMHFKFEVRRGDLQTPNSCAVRVYNLSDATVKRLQAKEFTKLSLQGGYDGNFGVLFMGGIKYVYRGHETPVDSYIDIVAADGDSAYNFAIVNTTLAAGSTAGQHVAVLATSMQSFGITPAQLPPLPDIQLPRGKVFFGMSRDFMRDVAKTTNCSWSIQDGKLTMLLQTSYAPGEIIDLNSATGLIGFPEQTQNGIRMRALLNPAIKIGSRVRINNADVQQFHFDLSIPGQVTNTLVPKLDDDGIYKVLISEHSGDTRGQAWYTNLTCIGVNASIPPKSPLIYKAAVNPYAAS